ncbi:PAS domain-containing protein [Candidatus Sumerlaeota bacterium]|nr:PAS domain-containing protein [Candidatus Sumerlaeota bacterium]
MSKKLRVLMVEDSKDDAELITRELVRGGFEPEITRVESPAEMMEALKTGGWDCVLSDFSIGRNFTGLDAVKILRESRKDIPFILITGSLGEENAIQIMRSGASDFVPKDKLYRLVPAIERELRETAIHRERQRISRALEASLMRESLMMRSLPVALYVAQPWKDSTTIWISENVKALTGFPARQFVDTNSFWKSRLHPEDRDRTLAEFDRVAEKGLATAEYRWLDAQNQYRWFFDTATYMEDEETGRQEIVGAWVDVTASKKSETRIREQMERLSSLRSIDMAITASLDLRVTLGVILDQVTSQLKVDAAAILLLNAHTQTLEFAAGRGFRGNALQHTRLRLGESCAGRAALERERVVCGDLAQGKCDFCRSPQFGAEGFIGYVAEPLVAKGHIKGVLEIFHRSPLAPDQDWLDFLETLGGQTAIAVDNAALFDDLQKSNADLSLSYEATLEGWVKALDLRDKETEGHTQRVTELTLRLAREMGFKNEELVHIRRGALLHDIGKLGIPDSILHKPGKLTDEEWKVMRMHPVYAHDWLHPIPYLRPALDIPHYHHEKWDGTGYPQGLKGEIIPIPARMFAIIDVWDALRSDRPYRAAWDRDKVKDHIKEGSGAHFDPEIVDIFMKIDPP